MESNVRNPKYNAIGSIDCEILTGGGSWDPFTADKNDIELQGRVIYEAIISGIYGEIEPYVEPEKTEDQIISEVLYVRNTFVSKIDAVATNAILWGTLRPNSRKS